MKKIEVFGIHNLPAGGGCTCSRGGPAVTMGEMYRKFEAF